MTPAKKTTTAAADAGEKKKEYKYQQEISQMVRARTQSRASGLPTYFGCSLQMFVFGEIQEPLTETVNLVENIIKSQLVELVRSPLRFDASCRLTLPF